MSDPTGAPGKGAPVIWTNSAQGAEAPRPLWRSMARGARLLCPNCGARSLFSSYLRVADACAACGEELHHHRADDAPPYFTIFIAGHMILPPLMTVELMYEPPVWLHLALWLPLTVIVCLALLPRVKGAIVGLQWAHRMHGFETKHEESRKEKWQPDGTG